MFTIAPLFNFLLETSLIFQAIPMPSQAHPVQKAEPRCLALRTTAGSCSHLLRRVGNHLVYIIVIPCIPSSRGYRFPSGSTSLQFFIGLEWLSRHWVGFPLGFGIVVVKDTTRTSSSVCLEVYVTCIYVLRVYEKF